MVKRIRKQGVKVDKFKKVRIDTYEGMRNLARLKKLGWSISIEGDIYFLLSKPYKKEVK